MTILLLISGNPDLLLDKSSEQQVLVIKVDDKIVSQPGRVKQIIHEHTATTLLVGTKDLKYQRFQIIWKLLFLLTRVTTGCIIDETGNRNKYSLSRLIFIELPMLLVECIASVIMIVWAYCMFPILRKKRNV